MTVESQGKRHALLLASGSVDLKNTYVFQVVPRMVKKSLSKSLSYWSTANGDDTMVTVWNPADEAQDYRVTVNFDGGHYRLPIHLDARATRNFNLSELIQSQIPDDEGNVIPLGVHEGSARISGIHADNESILVAVDGGVYNARKATCWYYCIECSGAELASLIAEPLVVKKGGQATLSLVTTDNNGNTSYAPAASWSSSNTYVASISGQAEDSTLTVTGNAAGSANFYASSSEVPIYSSNYCAYNAECPDEGYVNGSGGGTVAPLSITSVSGFVYGSTGPFVITGTGFSTFNTSGQPPSIGLSGGGVTFSGVAVTSTTITGTYTSTCGAVVGQQTITVNFPNADVQGGIPVTGTASVSLPAAPTPFIKFNGNSISGTQSVVVGQQIALSASVSLPNCMNLSLQQWSLPSSSGTPIGNYQASTTSGAVTGIGSVIASSSNYTFYWTTAGNSLTEQYEYTMAPSSGGGEVYSPAATATFNVSAPTWTGNSISATPSTLSISPLGGSVGPVLSFGHFTGTPPNLSGTPGITFSTSAHQPSGSNGTFSWAQIILGDTLTYTTSGGGQSPCNMGSGLDNLFPYPSQSATSTSDSPYMTLPSSYAIAQRSFSAQMYLLWNSNTTNSIYVSVGSVKWSFSGTATQTAGTWAVTSGNPPPAPTYQPYNGEPTWSSHTQNGVCQGNTN